jgi:hypothetical protein
MMSSALVTMLLVAANPTAQARESYARCLKDFVREGVEKKLEAAAFESAFAAACRDKEAAFKNARVTADVAMGIKRAAAEKGLAEEITDYRSMAKEDFVDAIKASAPQ